MNHLYEIATGRIVSSTSLPIPVIPDGMAVKASELTGMWNETLLDFEPRPVSKKESRLDFIDRFTDDEMELIMNAERTNNKIAVFLQKLNLANEVDRESARTINAVNGLESLGIINAGRAAVILA